MAELKLSWSFCWRTASKSTFSTTSPSGNPRSWFDWNWPWESGRDVDGFRSVLEEEPRFLSVSAKSTYPFRTTCSRPVRNLQNHLLETCAYGKGVELAGALLDLEPAIKKKPPENSRALVYAIDSGDRDIIELLLPDWKPMEELPTWAGLGRLDKVRSFFDEEGKMRAHPEEVDPEGAHPSRGGFQRPSGGDPVPGGDSG